MALLHSVRLMLVMSAKNALSERSYSALRRSRITLGLAAGRGGGGGGAGIGVVSRTVPIINWPVFTCKIEVSIVLHLA